MKASKTHIARLCQLNEDWRLALAGLIVDSGLSIAELLTIADW
jgi:hypothetical protein